MSISSQTALKEVPPGAQLLQLVGGAFISQAVYVAAKLGIADLLKDGPKTAEYLAVATSSDERSLYRVMRALASVGAFVETSAKTFENSPMSETLCTDHAASTRELTIWMGEPEHWKVYGELHHSVKTGKPAWDMVHGQPVFPYLIETNKELGDIFNRAMTSYSAQTIPSILDAYNFSGAGTIADIAGGYGHLLGAVLKTAPNTRGVLFDLPAVLERAPKMLESYGVSDRVELIGGDFNAAIPVVADIYLLKHIIHDWYDETNRKILGNIRSSMAEDAKILIIDAVIPEDNSPHFAKIIDIEMLVSPGGVERTASEFETLLTASGLKLTRIIPTQGPLSIVEAVKAN